LVLANCRKRLVLQCVTERHGALQRVVVCCGVLRCVAVRYCVLQGRSGLQCVAVCGSVLRCIVLCCRVLQCITVFFCVLQCDVYHTPKTPTRHIRVAQPSVAPLLRSFEFRAAFSRRRGMYRHSQEEMHWLSLVRKGVWGLRRRG